MATRYPGALDRDPDELPDNIADSDNLNSPNHATVHNNVNGAVLQIEEKLGIGDTTPSSGAVLIGDGVGSSAWDTSPTFVGDVTIPEGDLILGSTAVTSTAAELNKLDGVTATTAELNTVAGVTAGTVSASKTVVVDANKDVTGFRNITATGDVTMPEGDLILGSTAVTATATEINVLDGVTGGTVAASKGVVVDANKDVTGFRNITATGDVTIPDGDLILGSTAVTATATEINAVADGALDWTAWTPTFTNWTKGNATVNAKYAVVGNICYYQFYYLGGSTSAYTTGGMRFSVPVATSTDLQYQPTGIGWARPTSTSTIYSIFGMEISETIVMYSQKTTLNFTFNDVLDSVTPASWNTSSPYGDIFLQGWYRIA